MLILLIAVIVATLATPLIVSALWRHLEARELRRQFCALRC
jgi:hypothetical protein